MHTVHFLLLQNVELGEDDTSHPQKEKGGGEQRMLNLMLLLKHYNFREIFPYYFEKM